MSHWNYRIVSEVNGDHTDYYITEVYYDDDGAPTGHIGQTGDLLVFDVLEDLKSAVEGIARAVLQPVLRLEGDKLVENTPMVG